MCGQRPDLLVRPVVRSCPACLRPPAAHQHAVDAHAKSSKRVVPARALQHAHNLGHRHVGRQCQRVQDGPQCPEARAL
eukprot:6289087-Lingulodinium_polyedra.AAC.1